MTLGSRESSGWLARNLSLWQQQEDGQGGGDRAGWSRDGDGAGQRRPGDSGDGGPHLQPDWLAMAATLQPEGKMTVARLKHSL